MSDVRKEILQALREAYGAHTKRKRNIKLPSALGIENNEDGLLLQLNATLVAANMQTDEAAAEAWALVLRLWLGEKHVPRVVLDWEVPSRGAEGHYQRFLYRVGQFCKLFPEWFKVANPEKLRASKALGETLLILNVASKREGRIEPRTSSREYKIESALWNSEQFRQHFGLDRVDRQFPVGLFAGTVSHASRIFTGGKSAIDIVGVGRDRRFWIFELKAGENISVGTLSELLLYTGVIREAARESPRIQFDHPKQDSRVGPKDVQECTGINAVMVVENLHPLLEHPDLLDCLNDGAEIHWNSEPAAKPVCFSKARITEGVMVSDFEVAAEASA